MDYLRLTVGLLLPWIGGYFWLGWLERRVPGSPEQGRKARQLGFGLFIGLAALYLLIQASSALLQQVTFWPIAASLAGFALIGAWLYFRQHPATGPANPLAPPVWKRPAGLALLALICAHLAFGLGEVLNLPVFPWDAWLAWVYRAKAWFYSGHLAPFAYPGEWLAGSELYTMAAAGYPEFPSVMPYWAAVSLGHWSETLVNLPTFLCGLGLGLGVYGASRGYGLGPLASLLGAYLLLSIPMVGTHLSLAGYGDIWMAGYAGLGMLALLTGLIQKQALPIAVGLILLLLSTQVKNEGFVWLYLGLGLVAISVTRTRYLAAILGIAAILTAVAIASGISHITLPGIGLIGIENGQLHLPFIQAIKLHHYPLAAAYQSALFEHSSWSLLAAALLLAVVVIAFACRGRERLLLLTAAVMIVLSQVLIFGYTEQGRWAVSYTAINRLPMQITPVLAFLVVAALTHLRTKNPLPQGTSWPARLVPLLALIVVVTHIIWQLQPEQAQRAAPALVSEGTDMRAAMGRAIKSGGTIRVTGYQNGVAIISARKGRIDAELYQHLEVDLFSDGSRQPAFFWRTAAKPADLQILDIDDEASSNDLSSHPGWQGSVIEIGLAFYDSGASLSQVRQLSLHPASTGANIASLLDSWWTTLPWRQASVNWVEMGRGAFPPVAILTAWLALTAVALGILAALPPALRRRNTLAVLIPALVIAWVALDIQWLHQRESRLERTLEVASQSGKAYIAMGGDKHMAELAHLTKSAMTKPRQRVIIAPHDGTTAFEPLRLKYHLLPLNAHLQPPKHISIDPEAADAVLLVTKSRNPDAKWLEQWQQTILQQSDRLQPATSTQFGTLLTPANE